MLRGDLDIIVAKALKKDAAERYALRHGARRRSAALPPARADRRAARHAALPGHELRPATRARRGGVGAPFSCCSAARRPIYTNRLATERDRAQREAAKAAKVSELLTGLLTARRSISRFARRRQEPDRARPARRRRGAGAEGTGRTAGPAGGDPDRDGADLPPARASTTRRSRCSNRRSRADTSAFGAEHVQIWRRRFTISARCWRTRGDYPAAGRSLERSLAMRRKLLGERTRGRRRHAVGARTGLPGRGVQRASRAASTGGPAHQARGRSATDHRETAVSLSDLASVLRLNGDLAGAELLLQQCLETNRKTRGDDHPNTVTTAARSRADRGNAGRSRLRRIACSGGCWPAAQHRSANGIRSWPRAQQPGAGARLRGPVRRSGGRAEEGARHRPPRAGR